LANGLREAFDEVGIAEVVDYRSAAAVRKSSSPLVHLALLNRGIFAAPRDMFCISTRMDSLVIDDTFSQFTDALKEVRPVVERGD
jgi:glutamate-1-semialdehyde aminotransferase